MEHINPQMLFFLSKIIIMTKLKEIGFVNYQHLDKLKRDGIERMIWNGIYKSELFSIIIKKDKDTWVLDRIFCPKFELELQGKLFYKIKSLESVVEFIIETKTHIY
jgi:hypothetical protein